MNLHTKADELENFFLIEQFLHLPQFVQIGEIRVKHLSFVERGAALGQLLRVNAGQQFRAAPDKEDALT